MVIKIVHYRVFQDKLATVLPAIQEFVQAIDKLEPHTRYEAYQADDEVSFVHLMAFPDPASESRHQEADHTRRFVETLYPNCHEPPVFTNLTSLATTSARLP